MFSSGTILLPLALLPLAIPFYRKRFVILMRNRYFYRAISITYLWDTTKYRSSHCRLLNGTDCGASKIQSGRRKNPAVVSITATAEKQIARFNNKYNRACLEADSRLMMSISTSVFLLK